MLLMEAIYDLIQMFLTLPFFLLCNMCAWQKVRGYISKYFSLSALLILFFYSITLNTLLLKFHMQTPGQYNLLKKIQTASMAQWFSVDP